MTWGVEYDVLISSNQARRKGWQKEGWGDLSVIKQYTVSSGEGKHHPVRQIDCWSPPAPGSKFLFGLLLQRKQHRTESDGHHWLQSTHQVS